MFKKLVGLLTVAVVGLVFSGVASAQIATTAHDFSGETYTTEICNVCHTPHNSVTSVSDAPLWDHTVSTGGAGWTPYTSTTLDADTSAGPTGISVLCLSCHDGTIAIDSFGGVTPGTTFMTGAALVGIDLSNDHPISFTYNTALSVTDSGLNNPATEAVTGGTITSEWLFGDQLECASCHDVHDDTISPFLRTTNANSALCTTCHNK